MSSGSIPKAPDFSSKEYWQQRFAWESSFEWLQPSESMLPVIDREIRVRGPASVLHIGSGTSDLSNHLRRLLSDHPAVPDKFHKRSMVLNVDFSSGAIERGRRREREEFSNSSEEEMRWAVVNLLDWQSFKCAWEDHHGGKAFDIIVDKSCTDALSCGPDIEFPRSFCGKESASLVEEDLQLLPPASVLAMHLAAVTQPGAVWVALSYSAERFDFLRDSGDPAALKWSVQRSQKLLATGDESSAGEDRDPRT